MLEEYIGLQYNFDKFVGSIQLFFDFQCIFYDTPVDVPAEGGELLVSATLCTACFLVSAIPTSVRVARWFAELLVGIELKCDTHGLALVLCLRRL